jgi:LysM repeat protein
MGDYVVKEGDSYAKIAAQSGMDPRLYIELMHHNNSKRLRPGDVIDLPGASTLQSESNRILQGKGQASKYKAPGAAAPLQTTATGNATAPSVPIKPPNAGHSFGAINTQVAPAVPGIPQTAPATSSQYPWLNQPGMSHVYAPSSLSSRTPTPYSPTRATQGRGEGVTGEALPGSLKNIALFQGLPGAQFPGSMLIPGAGPAGSNQLLQPARQQTPAEAAAANRMYFPPARMQTPAEKEAAAKMYAGLNAASTYVPVKGEAPITSKTDIRLSLGAWEASHPGQPKPQWAQDLDPTNMQSWLEKRMQHQGGWIGGAPAGSFSGGGNPDLDKYVWSGGLDQAWANAGLLTTGNYANPYGSYSYRGGYGYGGGGGGGGGASMPGGIVWRIGLS